MRDMTTKGTTIKTKAPATTMTTDTTTVRKPLPHIATKSYCPPAKAQAAGVAVNTVEPGVFNQVIKTSGQVMAAQGDESVAVATVAGVVSFHGKVIEA